MDSLQSSGIGSFTEKIKTTANSVKSLYKYGHRTGFDSPRVHFKEARSHKGNIMTHKEYLKYQKRNKEIYEKYKAGAGQRELGKEYGLSHTRIQNLITHEADIINQREIDKKAKELYDKIIDLPLNPMTAVKLFEALRRAGIKSLQDLKDINPDELKKKKFIGDKTIQTLRDGKLIKEQ